MPKEYQVKINVDSTAAEKKILQFEQKAQRTFDKLNKTSFKPTAFINGINVSITKVMELAAKQEQAAAKTAQANAKLAQENAKLAQSESKVAVEKEKTAQATAKAAAAQAKANADIEKSNAKVIASENKRAGDIAKAHAQVTASANKMSGEYAKAQAQMTAAQEKTVQTQISGMNKLTGERIKAQNKLEQADKKQQESAQKTGNTVKSENNEMAASYTKLASSATTAWNQIKMVIGYAGVASLFRSALTEMKAMSDELVTYQKVTGATAEQMKQVRASAYESAKQYGQAPSDYLEAVARMARAGYGQQAEAMANLATKTQLVGDMSAEMASKFLIAVDAGYRLNGSISELEKVLNSANVADNNYATSLEQIAEGMTLIAPLAAGMNVSVEETTAAIGTMQALTQRSGTEVARALRMIMINIAKDTETEVEEGFKLTEENIDSFNALLQEFAKEELAAADAAGKLLNPMKAIGALAKAWKSGRLTEQDLFKVLNDIGGARYTNNIMALVKNFDVYEEMLGKFSTELTSANDEVNAMMDSWTRKLEVLKTTWTELVNDRVSEDFIKSLFDMGTGFLKWTGNLENFILVSGGAVKAISALSAGLKNLASGAKFGALNGWTLGISALIAALGAAKAAYDNYKSSLLDTSSGAAEQAKQTYEQTKRVEELIARYKELSADGVIDSTELGEVETIQEEINTLVGELPGKYDLVTGSIEKSKEALAKMSEEQRKSAMISAREAVNTTGKAMVDYGKSPLGAFTGLNTLFPVSGPAGAAYRFISSVLGDDSMFSVDMDQPHTARLDYTGKATAEEILKGYDELSAIINQATEEGLKETAADLYYALIATRDYMKDVVENYRSSVDYYAWMENGDYSHGGSGDSGSGNSGSSGSGGGSGGAAGGGAKGAVETWDRLADAIDKATAAKTKFDEAMSESKADAANDYIEAYQTLIEELKNGKVNSNATHAAMRMLLGEDAYNATGGSVQALQTAWTGKGAGQQFSREEAWKILTGTYQNQNGQVVEGAGLAVLAEKIGIEVRDALGNYRLDLTDKSTVDRITEATGLTAEVIRNFANMYDQYDIYGKRTQGTPQEQDSEEKTAQQAQTDNTTATGENTTATGENTTATEENTKALNTLTEKLGKNSDKQILDYNGGGPDTTGAEIAAVQDAEKKVVAAMAAPNNVNFGTKSALAGLLAGRGAGKRARADKQADIVPPSMPEPGPAPASKPEATPAPVAAPNPTPIPTPTANPRPTAHGRNADDPEWIGRSIGEANGEVTAVATPAPPQGFTPLAMLTKNAGDQADAEKQAEELTNAAKEAAEKLGDIDLKTEANAEANRGINEALDYWQTMLNIANGGDTSGYTGGSIGDLYSDYSDLVARQGGKEYAENFIRQRIKENKGQQANFEAEDPNLEITAHIKAVLEKEPLEAAVGALEYLEGERFDVVLQTILDNNSLEDVLGAITDELDSEKRAAVIEAVLERYSMEEVLGALDSATDETRVAVISATIDKYGEDAVAKFIANLPPEKQSTYLNSLIQAGAQGTINKYLDMLPDEQRTTVLASLVKSGNKDIVNEYLKSLPAEQRTTVLKSLINSGNEKIVTQYLESLPEKERLTVLKALKDAESGNIVKNFKSDLPPAITETLLKALLDDADYKATKKKLDELSATRTKYIKVVEYSGNSGSSATTGMKENNSPAMGITDFRAVGAKNHPGGLAVVNDGTGAELIVDQGRAYIANGGKPAVVNLHRGATVLTAEQTRRLPHYAVGVNNNLANLNDGYTNISGSRALAERLNAYFDSITTGDSLYSLVNGDAAGGSKSGTSGSSGKKRTSDDDWNDLKALIEYVLKRLGKALEEQTRIIDAQIDELNQLRSQNEQQNKLAELQKAVTDAEADLLEARSNRTVRYLDENGQWTWMADAGKVKQAEDALSKSQKSLQDYLNDLVIDAQIKALEEEKNRLTTEYNEYTDLWSDILDAVATPEAGLEGLLLSLTQSGTGAQKNGAAAVRNLLITALAGGSYGKNYNEAMGEIAKAAAGNPSVPGASDAALAALIASSGASISQPAMRDALQSIAGTGTLAYGSEENTISHQDTYYYINGVQIGADMANLPLSEVLSRLSVFTGSIQH